MRQSTNRAFSSTALGVFALTSLAVAASGCHRGDTPSNVPTAGDGKAASTRVLETGAAVLQTQPPIGAINAYLDGFHFYSGNMQGQMEAHHYCAILTEDLIQCVIYDGNVKDAKLMGVEYIVSDTVFAKLPEPEKALWHSHVHEVKSGQLVAPAVPDVAERELMEKLVRTYGKTWHTWHTDQHKALPVGVPQLMMGFTADGQANPDMVKARDERLGVDSTRKRMDRESIPAPPIDPGADAWQHGRTIQLADPTNAHTQ
jgi:hypothetical protein